MLFNHIKFDWNTPKFATWWDVGRFKENGYFSMALYRGRLTDPPLPLTGVGDITSPPSQKHILSPAPSVTPTPHPPAHIASTRVTNKQVNAAHSPSSISLSLSHTCQGLSWASLRSYGETLGMSRETKEGGRDRGVREASGWSGRGWLLCSCVCLLSGSSKMLHVKTNTRQTALSMCSCCPFLSYFLSWLPPPLLVSPHLYLPPPPCLFNCLSCVQSGRLLLSCTTPNQ